MALRRDPKGILRDLAKRRLPSDDLCEKIAAEKIAQHLELSGYLISQKPPRRPHSTR